MSILHWHGRRSQRSRAPQTVSASSSHVIVQATAGHLERRGLASGRDNARDDRDTPRGATCARHGRSHFEQIDSPERQRQKRSERYFYARDNCPHGLSTDRETTYQSRNRVFTGYCDRDAENGQ